MNKLIKRGVFGLVSLAVWDRSAFAASYTYTIINPEGVTDVRISGINDAGQVTGTSFDVVHDKSVSFIYSNGNFQPIPPPGNGSYSTDGVSIAQSGTVVGDFGKRQVREPFIFSPGDKKAVKLPGFPRKASGSVGGINASGEIVGRIVVQKVVHGYIYVGGSTTFLDVPGALATYANLVNASGVIAGYYYDGKKYYEPFVYKNGAFDLVKIPKAIETAITYLADDGSFGGWHTVRYVNNGDPTVIGYTEFDGTIATYRYPGATETFLAAAPSPQENFGTFESNSGTGAYHYLNGQYYDLKVPGTGLVFISGVNSSGSFAGYVGNGSNYTAFIATCAAGPGQCTD